MKKIINVIDYGARGDGIHDDSPAIQAALDCAGDKTVLIPDGVYRIVTGLKIRSDTEISAGSNARLIYSPVAPQKRGDFLLSSPGENGSFGNITVRGGIWDGNFGAPFNTKNSDIFDSGAASGTVLNFYGVKNLTLCNLTVANSVVYNIRLCRIDGFRFENIRFEAVKTSYNQDGLHFGGGCRNGYVRGITASDGQTNDDLIALNADDCVTRIENLGLICDDIADITFEDIYASDCHTAVRILSVTHSVCNISFRNIDCGCRVYAVNMDGARYCRTPLFRESDFPGGCGCINNVTFDGFRVHATSDNKLPLICAETLCRGFRIENIAYADTFTGRPLLLARNLTSTEITYDGNTCILEEKTDSITADDFILLTIKSASGK